MAKSTKTDAWIEKLSADMKTMGDQVKSMKEEYSATNKLNKKIIKGNTKEGKEYLKGMRATNKSYEELVGLVGTLEGTAKAVSRFAGMEEGIVHMFENNMAEMISNDEGIKSALKHGATDGKKYPSTKPQTDNV